MKSVQIIVSGRVQGVWFRAWTTKQATALGLAGWVRNRPDGTVEAVLSGPEIEVDRMIVLLRQGPPLANVSGLVITAWDQPTRPGFCQAPNA